MVCVRHDSTVREFRHLNIRRHGCTLAMGCCDPCANAQKIWATNLSIFNTLVTRSATRGWRSRLLARRYFSRLFHPDAGRGSECFILCLACWWLQIRPVTPMSTGDIAVQRSNGKKAHTHASPPTTSPPTAMPNAGVQVDDNWVEEDWDSDENL